MSCPVRWPPAGRPGTGSQRVKAHFSQMALSIHLPRCVLPSAYSSKCFCPRRPPDSGPSPGDQLHFGVGAGEIQIFAAVHDGRTGGTHMHFLRAAFVQEVHRLPQLGARTMESSTNSSFLPESVPARESASFSPPDCASPDWRSEGTGPCGGVLDEGTGEGLVGLVGVADGVGQTGVRHAATKSTSGMVPASISLRAMISPLR